MSFKLVSQWATRWPGRWVIGFVAAGAFAASPAWAELKIGVVDYGRLVEESPQAKSALESIRTEFTPRQRDLQSQQASLKAKEDRLQKDGATMATDQRTSAEKDLRDGYRELQRKQKKALTSGGGVSLSFWQGKLSCKEYGGCSSVG